MQLTAPFASLVLAVASVAALPAIRSALDVFVPPITYPHAGTQWYRGQTHNVTWDTSNAPVNITNRYGRINLVRAGNVTDPIELAQGFDILLGRIEVQVPDYIQPRNDYELVLFGDSGNFSPEFSIN
ncbi:hypothetical protein PLICRDRAFT_111363 [Plicaturopsis crispa FD-325 SS-3]|nr:hypothetical protein PLICRDRAFT_111363 [Plicaturopsis crispa FD-325 SS-3]